jgi:hypothetical protein
LTGQWTLRLLHHPDAYAFLVWAALTVLRAMKRLFLNLTLILQQLHLQILWMKFQGLYLNRLSQ